MNADWSLFHTALDRIADTGKQAQFWLRDDDAISVTAALRQLAQWADSADTEILLALVPSMADQELAALIAATPALVGAVHGWAHQNHAPDSEKKQELGSHRPIETVCAELAGAYQRTAQVCGDRMLPVLVPPWNRISPDVVQCLPELGFSGISTFADAFTDHPIPGLQVQNSHIDIIAWRGNRGGRPSIDLIKEMVTALEQRAANGQPIGILSHHLVHDAAAWSFLDDLSAAVDRHAGARWISPQQVFSA